MKKACSLGCLEKNNLAGAEDLFIHIFNKLLETRAEVGLLQKILLYVEGVGCRPMMRLADGEQPPVNVAHEMDLFIDVTRSAVQHSPGTSSEIQQADWKCPGGKTACKDSDRPPSSEYEWGCKASSINSNAIGVPSAEFVCILKLPTRSDI